MEGVPSAANPCGWPDEVMAVLGRAITVEFATLTRAGSPVTIPTTPYLGTEARTLDISTGLTYPAKAERARRDPRVALLYADPVGSGLDRAPVVLVQGLATVRDSDLQGNTDRYVRISQEKLPDATKGQPRAVLRRLAWYFTRIWVEVTPLHMRWWADRALGDAPRTWDAPEGTAAPLSDPAPGGKQPGPWAEPPTSWRKVAEEATVRLGLHDLSVTAPNGFPCCFPVHHTELTPDGFRLVVGEGAPTVSPGPACLTMHTHPERFTSQENRTFVGSVDAVDGTVLTFRAQRALADWSLSGGKVRLAAGFLAQGRRLGPRLRVEVGRRSQAVPKVRFPGEY